MILLRQPVDLPPAGEGDPPPGKVVVQLIQRHIQSQEAEDDHVAPLLAAEVSEVVVDLVNVHVLILREIREVGNRRALRRGREDTHFLLAQVSAYDGRTPTNLCVCDIVTVVMIFCLFLGRCGVKVGR